MNLLIGELKNEEAFVKIFEGKEGLDEIKNNNKEFFESSLDELKKEDFINFAENPEYKREEEQWFFVDYSENQEIQNVVNKYSEKFKSTAEIGSLQKTNLSNLKFIIYGQQKEKGNLILKFQSVKPASLIKVIIPLTYGNIYSTILV